MGDYSTCLILQCSLFCITQQWSQSAQACNCLTPASTPPLMKQPNRKRSCDGVEAGPGTETGCGSETSQGCRSSLWFKLSERGRIPHLNCHFNSCCVSLVPPTRRLGSLRVTCCWISNSNHRHLRKLTLSQRCLTWSLSPGGHLTCRIFWIVCLCPGFGAAF